jgi:hypothetical protein
MKTFKPRKKTVYAMDKEKNTKKILRFPEGHMEDFLDK